MNKTLTALCDSFYTPPQSADTRTEFEAIHIPTTISLTTMFGLSLSTMVWTATRAMMIFRPSATVDKARL